MTFNLLGTHHFKGQSSGQKRTLVQPLSFGVGFVMSCLLWSGGHVCPAYASSSKAPVEGAEMACVVNDVFITKKDLKARIDLTLLSSNAPLNHDNRLQAQQMVLKTMIDESMKLSVCKRFKILPEEKEVKDAFERVTKRSFDSNGKVTLGALMKQHAIPESVLKNHLMAEMGWRNYLAARFQPSIQVSSDEVAHVLKDIKAGKTPQGLTQFLEQKQWSFVQVIFPFKKLMSAEEKEALFRTAQSVARNALSPKHLISLAQATHQANVMDRDRVLEDYIP